MTTKLIEFKDCLNKSFVLPKGSEEFCRNDDKMDILWIQLTSQEKEITRQYHKELNIKYLGRG